MCTGANLLRERDRCAFCHVADAADDHARAGLEPRDDLGERLGNEAWAHVAAMRTSVVSGDHHVRREIVAEQRRRRHDQDVPPLVEHDLYFVREISSRIIVLHQGKIALDGSVDEVVNSALVREIYTGQSKVCETAS